MARTGWSSQPSTQARARLWATFTRTVQRHAGFWRPAASPPVAKENSACEARGRPVVQAHVLVGHFLDESSRTPAPSPSLARLLTLSMPLSLGGPPHPARTRAHGHGLALLDLSSPGNQRCENPIWSHGDQVDISTQLTLCFRRCFSVPF